MTRAALGLGALAAVVVIGCGGAAPPEARSAPAAQSAPPRLPIAEPKDESKTMLEVIVVAERWVEKAMAAPAADVKAWGDVLANRAAIETDARRLLVRVKEGASDADEKAAKKKAEAALARIKKGEDFAKVAKELSDDAATKERGGLVRGRDVKELAPPVRAAYAALAPGDLVKEPVRTPLGWDVLRREAPTEEQLAAAYRRARAPELANKLATDILARLRTEPSSRAAVATAVEAVLGEGAEADPDRPQAMLVDAGRIDAARLPREAKSALSVFAKKAHPGETLEAPLGAPHALVVARVASPAASP